MSDLAFDNISSEEIRQILELHTIVQGLSKKTVEHVIELGEKLAAVKTKLRHGMWLPFCRHLGISDQTVRNYIMVWKNRDLIKSQNILNLVNAYAVTLPEPEPEPEPAPYRAYKAKWEQLLSEFAPAEQTEFKRVVLNILCAEMPEGWRFQREEQPA